MLQHISRNRFWTFCMTRCSMMGENAATPLLLFSFMSYVVLRRFSYNLLLRYSQRNKSQALRSGDLAGHSLIPSSWDNANWGHLVENSHCIPRIASRCLVLLKPDSLDFNTNYLQSRFQKWAKHPDTVGCWFVCLVFKELGIDQPKRCYTITNTTFSEYEGSWRTSRAFSVAQYHQFWELTQLERWKFASSAMIKWLLSLLPWLSKDSHKEFFNFQCLDKWMLER